MLDIHSRIAQIQTIQQDNSVKLDRLKRQNTRTFLTIIGSTPGVEAKMVFTLQTCDASLMAACMEEGLLTINDELMQFYASWEASHVPNDASEWLGRAILQHRLHAMPDEKGVEVSHKVKI